MVDVEALFSEIEEARTLGLLTSRAIAKLADFERALLREAEEHQRQVISNIEQQIAQDVARKEKLFRQAVFQELKKIDAVKLKLKATLEEFQPAADAFGTRVRDQLRTWLDNNRKYYAWDAMPDRKVFVTINEIENWAKNAEWYVFETVERFCTDRSMRIEWERLSAIQTYINDVRYNLGRMSLAIDEKRSAAVQVDDSFSRALADAESLLGMIGEARIVAFQQYLSN